MDIKESAILGECAEAHWYYQSKIAAMRRYLRGLQPRLVLDVGAGSALFTKHLLQHTCAKSGVCVDTGYEKDWTTCFHGKSLTFRRELSPVEADLVLLMDVVEHVDDDRGLLRACAAVVPRGTRFFITAPAFQWLWSQHDVFLEHRRRYNLRMLECAIGDAGLQVECGSYFYGLVFPLAVATRLVERLRRSSHSAPQSQLRIHGPLTNGVLSGVCRAEASFVTKNRLAGLSVLCLAKKR